MSRIYEALQRAAREHKAGHMTDTELSPRVEDVAEIEEPSSVPIPTAADLENVAQYSWTPSLVSLPSLTDRGAVVEQFRSLRSKVNLARAEAPLKTILISSGMPSEGKSFVAANLATSLARNGGNNILLIDADLRRPTIHTLLGAPNVLGLSDYLAGTVELNEILQRNSASHSAGGEAGSLSSLTFIPSGKCGDNSSELIANHRFDELIAALSPHFDWILIDSPPVLAVTDATDLARAADAVLLVAREGCTPFDVARRAKAAFSNSRVLGFVLNNVKDAPKRGHYYYSGYYSREDADGNEMRGKAQRSQK